MMVEQNEWVFFRNIEWDCPNHNKFNVDTRDFHCGYQKNKSHKDTKTLLKNKEKFFLTQVELLELLERYYKDSGEWRLFELKSDDEKTKNWRLKYLRIYRIEENEEFFFIICNDDDRALNKSILECEVNDNPFGYEK
jgi:hypothetical protein